MALEPLSPHLMVNLDHVTHVQTRADGTVLLWVVSGAQVGLTEQESAAFLRLYAVRRHLGHDTHRTPCR